jgi:hypothetical protein
MTKNVAGALLDVTLDGFINSAHLVDALRGSGSGRMRAAPAWLTLIQRRWRH